MSKLKVAILEDSPLLLEEMRYMLRDTKLVDVVVASQTCEEFIQKVKQTKVDALILDIDISGDSMSGMDVAYHLKLPVLFASGKTKDNLEGIEDLTLEDWSIVEHLTKPIKKEKLERMLPLFIEQIRAKEKKYTVNLKVRGGVIMAIPINSVVFICSGQGNEGRSSNKEIHFTDRPPQVVVDKSFSALEEIGFTKNKFIQPEQSYRVNVDQVKEYDRSSHKLIAYAMNKDSKIEPVRIPVSENYRSNMRAIFR
jgi:DNA-binding LytR/AlgR family response regulator